MTSGGGRSGSNVVDLMAALKKSIEKPARRRLRAGQEGAREEGAGEEARVMADRDPLSTYNAKRDFTKTAEPKGTLAPGHGNRFMVQKHDATRLHWDLRLEVDGVMKSWAVTRGPSLNPDDKRLAVQTEDHPLSYSDFEGTIPHGRIWRRHGDAVGRRHLGADPGQVGQGPGEGPSPLHPRWRADEGRVAADPAQAARQGAQRQLAAAQDRGRICRRVGRSGRGRGDQRQDRADDGGDRGGQEGEGAGELERSCARRRRIPRRATSRSRSQRSASSGKTAGLPRAATLHAGR